jgi:hypothetical protein
MVCCAETGATQAMARHENNNTNHFFVIGNALYSKLLECGLFIHASLNQVTGLPAAG